MKKLITLAVVATLSLPTVAFANEATITAISAIPTEEVVTIISVDVETTSGDAITSDSAITPEVKVPVVDKATGEIMLPARETAEELGYTVIWHAKDKSISFRKDGNVFKAQVGSTKYTYNDTVVYDAPATILIDDYAYIPASIVNAMKPATETPQIQDPTGAQSK